MNGTQDAEGLSRRIAEYIVTTSYEDLSPAVVRATKRSLLDAIGVMMAATTLGTGCEPFADLAREGGAGSATLIGRGASATPALAALANGALAHAIDFEDGHDGAPVHPNAVPIPAALAWAEGQGGIDGRLFLTALAIGCDLVCRMGLALAEDPARHGWYPPPMFGAWGAVAACAKLAGLDADRIVDAFSLLLCSSVCSGEIKYSPLSDMRAVRDGFPAQAAVQAVDLAQRGVKGFAAPLEGKAGFFALYGRSEYDPARLLDGLGTRFEGENLTFKLWPSCRGTHAGIEGALALRGEDPGIGERIARIALTGHPVMAMLDAPHAAKRAPATAIDAKFSLPFTVATALAKGAVTLDSFTPEALRDETVLALARKADFTPMADLPKDAIASGGIAIHMRDGSVREWFVAAPRGAPANPLSQEELVAKFRACAALAAAPDDERAAAIVERIEQLEAMADMRELLG
ncbi:MmgE/PrpD family protein [Sphingomonas sp. AP4-R1]|uniref:MmgE/PrpD family protein n=1 Tax=Sphingomonas sp. AP4-R1 TaxID=2735134 RepID=UPI0014932DB2|nr:MmgE/PrpD family protein [Sphingomonas sp. AP4-R1]QJU59842.1 MmgE/PrpD family protein [Sphingomonas sp. AP4-R1]